MAVDRAALVVGGIRLASGVSFLVDPLRANRLWGEPNDPGPSARLLLRSMGYRDALIGGLLVSAGLRGRDTTTSSADPRMIMGPGGAGYSFSKQTLVTFTQEMALHLASTGVSGSTSCIRRTATPT
jgi:NAD(P)-dependent dehydrogenase (short-subunit alcohol dehydrogenase family)